MPRKSSIGIYCFVCWAMLQIANSALGQDDLRAPNEDLMRQIRQAIRSEPGGDDSKAVVDVLRKTPIDVALKRASYRVGDTSQLLDVKLVKPEGDLVMIASVSKAGTWSEPINTEVIERINVPIQSDVQLIELILPKVQAALGGAEESEARIAAYSAWNDMRFGNSTEGENQSGPYGPLNGDKLLAALSNHAYIRINSKPKGAQIYIDESSGWGTTEDHGYVPSGEIHITLLYDGLPPFKATETVQGRTSRQLEYDLNP